MNTCLLPSLFIVTITGILILGVEITMHVDFNNGFIFTGPIIIGLSLTIIGLIALSLTYWHGGRVVNRMLKGKSNF